MNKYSRAYKYGGKMFRYNREDHVVEWIAKPTKSYLKDNEEWIKETGRPMWDIVDGYIVHDSVGLREENWKNKEARDGYLEMWIDDIAEEARCEAQWL